jgi:hypothetical protein
LRTISPISAETRRLPPESFGLGFVGRPGIRTIAVCFGFLIIFGRIFGIARLTSILRALFSDKCLKKWYLLPVPGARGPGFRLPVKKAIHVMRVAAHEAIDADAYTQGKIAGRA